MPIGLETYDETGKLLLSASNDLLRILGSFIIPVGSTSFSFKIPFILDGSAIFYYAQGNIATISNSQASVPVPLFFFTHTLVDNELTINCNYYPAIMGGRGISKVDSEAVRVFYGVYY